MANQDFRAKSEGRLTGFGVRTSNAVPQFGSQPRTGLGLPGAPSVQAPRPINFSGIQQVLQSWQEQALQNVQEQQAEAASGAAAEAQTAMGVSGVAQAPDTLNRVERQAWQKQTTALYDQQIRTASSKKAAELQLAYESDPAGFDQAWAAYTDETLSTIAETDASLAAGARAYFESVGSRGSIALLEQQHANNANTKALEAEAEMFGLEAAAADIVRNNPTEQVLAEQLAEVRINLQQIADANILSGADVAKLERNAEINLTQNFVEGQVQQALADGDFDRAQLIEDELRAGKYFADNRLGDKLANNVARRAGALQNEINGTIIARERQQLGSAEAILQQMISGVPITPEQKNQLDKTFSELSNAIDPDVQQGATSLQAGIAAFEHINENINTMSFEQLQAARAGALSQEAFLTLPPRAQQAIVSRVDAEIERVNEAMSGANPDVAQAGLANVANADFYSLIGQTDLLNENRELAAERTGRPLDTMPFWNNRQVGQAATGLREAAEAGDRTQFNQIAEAYLAPYSATDSEAAGLRFLGEIDSEMGGIALVSYQLQELGIQDAAAFANTAIQGQALGTGHTISIGDMSVEARRKLMAMSETHGMKMNMVMSALTSYGRGLSVVSDDPPSDARQTARRVSDILSNVPTTTLGNNMEILSSELGTSDRVRELRAEAINEIYDDPTVRDFYDVENFRPVAMPDGSFQFRNKETGVFMYEQGDPQAAVPVTARVSDAAFVEARQADLDELEAQADAASEAATAALLLTERPKIQFAAIAARLDIPAEDAMGLFRAISLSPGRVMHRMPGGVAPEVLAETPDVDEFTFGGRVLQDKSRLTPEMQVAIDAVDSILAPEDLPDDPEMAEEALSIQQTAFGNVSPQDEGRLATLVLFGGYMQRFGDRRMALAAIHAGEEELTAAMELGGEEWLDQMDQETRAFVAKGMRM